MKEKNLFPGYLFLHFAPEEIHTTQITRIPGALQFIRFGDALPYVVPEAVIQGLRDTLLLQVNDALACIEYRNVPSELAQSLRQVVGLRSEAERRMQLLAILQNEYFRTQRWNRQHRNLMAAIATSPDISVKISDLHL